MADHRRVALAWSVVLLSACRTSGDVGSAHHRAVVRIDPGSFTMGCVEGRDDVERGCWDGERPPREVTLAQPFEMMVSEVTQGMWSAAMGNNPSWFGNGSYWEHQVEALGYADTADPAARTCGEACPVENVSWWDAVAYANAVSAAAGLDTCYTLSGCTGTPGGWGQRSYRCLRTTVNTRSGHPEDCEGWRLPTEAEWEYAARGGQDFAFAGSNELDDIAWQGRNSAGTTHPMCHKARNGHGLCDMSGNVLEWTWDRYVPYEGGASAEPYEATSGALRVFRGGSWANVPQNMSIAHRFRMGVIHRPVAEGRWSFQLSAFSIQLSGKKR